MITTFVRILSVFRVLFPLHGCTPFFVCIWYFMLSIFQEPTIMCLTQFMSVSPLKTQMCHCMYVPSTRIRGATAPPQCVEWERLNKIIHRINWMTVNPSKAVLQLTNSQQAKKKKKIQQKKNNCKKRRICLCDHELRYHFEARSCSISLSLHNGQHVKYQRKLTFHHNVRIPF